jgi:hypothetical protein
MRVRPAPRRDAYLPGARPAGDRHEERPLAPQQHLTFEQGAVQCARRKTSPAHGSQDTEHLRQFGRMVFTDEVPYQSVGYGIEDRSPRRADMTRWHFETRSTISGEGSLRLHLRLGPQRDMGGGVMYDARHVGSTSR